MAQYGKEFLYLTEEEVQQCMTMAEAVKLAEIGIIEDGKGNCNGDKFYMNVGDKGFIKPFTGFLAHEEYGYVKTFTMFNENYKENYPNTVSTVLLFEKNYGMPVCFMLASWITGLKTGASTAVTVKHLKSKDADTVTLFGAGLQAKLHLEGLAEVMKIKEARVLDIVPGKAAEFAREMGEKTKLNIIPMSDKEQAVRGSDVILTLTTTSDVLVRYEWLKPGAFVGKLGSYQEIEPSILKKADKFVVDRWKYVAPRVPEIVELVGNGELKETDALLWPQIACGKTKGRESEDEIIVYACLGIWGEYAAILPQVYRNAVRLGLGQKMPLHYKQD